MSEQPTLSTQALKAMFPDVDVAGDAHELCAGFKRVGLRVAASDADSDETYIALQLFNHYQLVIRPYGDTYGETTLWTATTHEVRQRIRGRNPMEAMMSVLAGESHAHAHRFTTFRVIVALESDDGSEQLAEQIIVEASSAMELADQALKWAQHASRLPLAYSRRQRTRRT